MTEKDMKTYWNTLCRLNGGITNIITEREKLLATIKYPSSLYRFRSLSENSLNALQNNQVFFSSANYYDDPFDTFLRVDTQKLKDEFEQVENNGNYLETLFSQIFPNVESDEFKNIHINYDWIYSDICKIRDTIRGNLYSICFCEEVVNEVNWLKYAENHMGFVLEYSIDAAKIEQLWAENANMQANLLPIYYSKEKYNSFNYAAYYIILSLLADNQKAYNLQWRFPIAWENTKISAIKKDCHRYDNEWRIIPLYTMMQRMYITWKPKSVTIGLRTPAYKRQLIISASKIAGITEFYEMYINNNEDLDRRPIDV